MSKQAHHAYRLIIVLTAISGIAVHLHFHLWLVTIAILTFPIWAGILQILSNLVSGDMWNETMI